MATWSAPASASEWTAMVRRPRRFAVRITRQAISPRLATRTEENIVAVPMRVKRLRGSPAGLSRSASRPDERQQYDLRRDPPSPGQAGGSKAGADHELAAALAKMPVGPAPRGAAGRDGERRKSRQADLAAVHVTGHHDAALR